jgi:hypothetical protein
MAPNPTLAWCNADRVDTVKNSNFELHGYFGPLFQKSLQSSKRVLEKNEENKTCRKT